MRETQEYYDDCPDTRMYNGSFVETRLFLPMPKFKKEITTTCRKCGPSLGKREYLSEFRLC
jgi:hypothetical protein